MLGFFCNKADPSLFIYKKANDLILLLVYVDDVIITGNNATLVQKFIHDLGHDFALKDLGALHYFLGIEVKYFTSGLFLSQSKYTKDLLTRTNMLASSHLSTPIAIKQTTQLVDHTPVDETEYRSIVGALQYLTFTHPDITHAINKVCQHFHKPTLANLQAVKRILRYLKGSSIMVFIFYLKIH